MIMILSCTRLTLSYVRGLWTVHNRDVTNPSGIPVIGVPYWMLVILEITVILFCSGSQLFNSRWFEVFTSAVSSGKIQQWSAGARHRQFQTHVLISPWCEESTWVSNLAYPSFSLSFLFEQNTLGPVYNEFGYNEHPAVTSRFLCINIINCNVKNFGYNEYSLITNSFFSIFILIVSRTQCIMD